jgi:hypothetical protein
MGPRLRLRVLGSHLRPGVLMGPVRGPSVPCGPKGASLSEFWCEEAEMQLLSEQVYTSRAKQHLRLLNLDVEKFNEEQPPSVFRFLVRDQTTGRTLAVSTATMVHVELPADCAGQGSQACSSQPSPDALNGPAPGANGAQPSPVANR